MIVLPCSTDQGSSREGAAAVALVSASLVGGCDDNAALMRVDEDEEVWALLLARSMVVRSDGL